LTIGVMFFSYARKLAAPSAWVCALAVIVPSTSIAAVKVIVSLLMTFSFAE
jgi:hypothetical protein